MESSIQLKSSTLINYLYYSCILCPTVLNNPQTFGNILHTNQNSEKPMNIYTIMKSIFNQQLIKIKETKNIPKIQKTPSTFPDPTRNHIVPHWIHACRSCIATQDLPSTTLTNTCNTETDHFQSYRQITPERSQFKNTIHSNQ